MSNNFRYDAQTKTLWVFSTTDADTLVTQNDLQKWVKALKAQETPDGKPLSAVNYVFGNRESAEYNQQPLSFSRIGTYVGTLDAPVTLGNSPSFGTKEDMGI